MANSVTHSLPYPIMNARFSLAVTFRTSAGTPTDPTTPDTELSSDGGATFADVTEEITTGGSNGMGYITLTGAETNNKLVLLACKSANCLTTPVMLHCRNLATVGSGTLSAGSSGGGTLGTLLAYDVTGCFIRTTGGTGGGGTGGANNQARRILTYNTSTGAFTVSTWETTPDATTTYDVLLPEGVTLGMLRTLNPTTAGNTLDVSSGGEAGLDWANIGSKTTTNALTGTTIAVTQKVDVDTIKTQSVTCSGGVTVPAATLASTTNITAAAGCAVSSIGADVVNASALATDAVNEIRNAITGGAYALNTDAGGNVKISDGTGANQLDTSSGAVAHVILCDTTTTNTDLSTLFSGITSMAQWLGILAGKQSGNSTARTEIRATGAGSGTYDETTDSLEANRDNIGTAGAGLTAADDATLSAIAALNNITAASVWSVGTRLLTAGTNIALAKGTGVTGFNDISAADVWAAATRTLTSLSGLTVDTVTTLTNLPAITANWLTATGIASGAFTAAKFAADAIDSTVLATSAAQEIRNAVTGYAGPINCDSGGNVGVQDGTGANQIGLTSGAVDVVTTLTNAPGDSSGTTTLLSRLTSTRAGYLDNLSAGAVATAASIAALNNVSTAQVLAQVETALATTTRSMPGQATPSTTPTLSEAVMQLFQVLTNPSDQNASTQRIYNRAGAVVHQKRTVADDGTTATLGALVTGP